MNRREQEMAVDVFQARALPRCRTRPCAGHRAGSEE